MAHSPPTLLAILSLYGRSIKDNNNNDGRRLPVLRGSDDFWPTAPASHGPHLYANAMNALFLSHMALHDWCSSLVITYKLLALCSRLLSISYSIGFLSEPSLAFLFLNLDSCHRRDMFQSNLGKPSEMHAAARAISGGPVYGELADFVTFVCFISSVVI